ncbi:stage II sporulation protein M [Clostridium sp. 'deep sea']|uniref:stage II sporulation protein M n=1 Tax=Clostridium sp. 'deep sea' TaxID=2779445 RepID=UPI0018968299|nr:stage II sporulation protein M [Clostridium sp. 'deep sea']QOR35832.1 stage II sporulation protein M [Clostridium sp. 'deep sea']
MEKLYKYHIKTNKKLYIFLLVTFFIGLIAGSLSATYLNSAHSSELANSMLHYINTIQQGKYEVNSGSINLSNIYLGVIMAISGLFSIGILIIFFAMGAKGFLLGFTINYALMNLGGRGWLLVIFSLIPPTIIVIPTLLFQAVVAGRVIIQRHSGTLINKRSFGKNKIYKEYTILSLCALALLLFSGIVEVYISPLLLQFFLNIFY